MVAPRAGEKEDPHFVSQAMSREVASVGPDARLREARRVAEATGARHLLVLDAGNLVGILCLCDLRGAPADACVADLMSVPVLTVRPDATLAEAADTMRECEVGCLPVVMGGLLLGTISGEELARVGLRVPGGADRCACGCHPRRHPSA